MSTSYRQVVLSNPDEHIASEEVEAEANANPYRTNTFTPAAEPLPPFNWGPLKRTGKLGLVVLPLTCYFTISCAHTYCG